ncbi:DsbA family protein [Tolumonas lignilytica]|jgi:Protein-disulfide isomerase|uniref:DsbA family protein n=1 Tax=Tolumonas lignilytica TaxID=1283284 RepID=UPI0004644DC2|nr:DsbA family protein [Tolumonas lignilytica]
MKLKTLATALLCGMLSFSTVAAEMTKAEVEKIVREYLVSNPEILIEMSNALRAKQEMQQSETDKALLKKHANQLFQQADDPVTGNPKGSLTIVEFVDYNCGYCKRSAPLVQELLKKDQDIRYIYKEFPILTETSVIASKAALAVNALFPAKYAAFHDALMAHEGALKSTDDIASIAQGLGLDWNKISEKAKDPAIERKIAINHAMAQTLNITGTPAFIIGDQLLRGAPQTLDMLEQSVHQARGK